MNKFLFFVLFFIFVGCDRTPKKKHLTPTPLPTPVIVVRGNAVIIDSLLLKPYGGMMLKDFYSGSGYKSVWQSKKNRTAILEQLSNADEEGLNSARYDIMTLRQLEKKYAFLKDKERARYDFLLTHNFQKYILHLTNGRCSSMNIYKDWDLKKNAIDINETIALMLKSDSLAHKIELLKPNHVVYRSLKKALKIINSFPDDDFTAIPLPVKIELNDTNSVVINIKKRLIYWKDLKPKDSLSGVYDSVTNEAMKRFQTRHGLLADGVIGKGTVDALNVSRRKRRGQILANLERWKWFPKELGEEYVIVNIPDYKLVLVKGNDTIRTHRIIVGRAKRPTPVLSSNVTHVVLNPTWTVPPTILKEDVIPAISHNRAYLAQTNMKIYDGSGREVPAYKWKRTEAKTYRYVQSSGTFNSLGMVKILFPNRFSVYLHDTNHRDLFFNQKRSLSSGCVRVQNPVELAAYLLNDQVNWKVEKITQALKSGKTKYVKIKKGMGIYLLYWTAWTENNTLIFRDDIYKLDADLHRKLGQ